MNIHVDQFQRQIELEIEMAGLGTERYHSRINKDIEGERGANTRSGSFLMKRAINPLASSITAFVDEVYSGAPRRRATAARLVKDMDHFAVAYLTTRVILNRLMLKNSVPLLTLARSVANAVEDEARFSKFKTANPGLYKMYDAKLTADAATEQHKRTVLAYAMGKYDIPWDTWTKTDKIHLGIKLVELFIENTGLAEFAQAYQGMDKSAPHDQYIVQLTNKTTEWIEMSVFKGETLYPVHLPTIIPPKDWTSLKGGGYHSEATRPLPLVRKARSEQLRLLEDANLDTVYQGLNAIQQTPWTINQKVLDVMTSLIDAKSTQAGLISLDDLHLPPRPFDIDTNPEALKKWKWEARDVHTKNLKLKQERLTQTNLMNLAHRFKDETLYFPHNLDFRGRAYPVPTILHPQGSDNVKALLQFSEGLPLGDDGEKWLAIHGANCFGVDKVSFEKRIKWVNDHAHHIARTANDPLGYTWWMEADSPWCFLAFCMEWWLVGSPGFVSHIPVALDGSCNGLQHFSAMLRDLKGGAAVNLLPADDPQDIYQRVADRVIEQLRLIASTCGEEEAVETPEDDKKKGPTAAERIRWSHGWVHFGIDRKITKRPVMVLPYGGTPRSCLKYVQEAIGEKIAGGKEHNFGEELNRAIGFLSGIVWDSIGDVVVAAKDAMGWLQSVARVVAKDNLPLSWKAPSGFVAFQQIMDLKQRQVKTNISGRIVRPAIYDELDSINIQKQATSISPNFVHSLDAAAMIRTVALLYRRGIRSFAMIHDSYGTHACNATRLSNALRYEFVSMYRNDVLADFRNGLPPTSGELAPLPQKGELNLSKVYEADYFFA